MKSELHKHSIQWLVVALVLAVLPHALRVPYSVTAFFLLLVGWRYWLAVSMLRVPPRWVRLALATVGGLFVYFEYHTVIGRDAGVALLIAMLAIKLLELQSKRDAYVSVLIGYFLVVTHFLYSQSMPTAAYMLVAVVMITATLVDLNRVNFADRKIPLQNVRLGFTLLGQALPFMLVLFVLFPRISTPLWGLPSDAFGGTTGLGEDMEPGAISELSQSDDVAFRANFAGAPPSSEFLYWRGPVLWYTDGRKWRVDLAKNAVPRRINTPDYFAQGSPVKYTVTVEPHRKRWLFALDLPATVPANSILTYDYQLRAGQNVDQRLRYEVESYLSFRTPELDYSSRVRGLQLPSQANPRTVALGRQWRRDYDDDAKILFAALQMFRVQPFVYTLAPPRLDSANSVDEFLFETQQGFCEHYASSFVVLMRAAGIPARVVTGYQGGELNTVGKYLIIRQRDAHAWAEIWLPNSGWVRIDPTAAVAPERVRLGIQGNASRIGEAVRFQDAAPSWLTNAIREMRFGWDSVNNGWNQWVLSYNQAQQLKILRDLHLGVDSVGDMMRVMMATVIALLAVVSTVMLVKRGKRLDPVSRLWSQFCRKLAHKGFAREPAEGPMDYAHRITQARPDLASAIQAIAQLYVKLHYGPQQSPNSEQLSEFRQRVRRFRV